MGGKLHGSPINRITGDQAEKQSETSRGVGGGGGISNPLPTGKLNLEGENRKEKKKKTQKEHKKTGVVYGKKKKRKTNRRFGGFLQGCPPG